ncbi:MAG: protein kinase [Planctomycetaceae bacterium]|nr:protein kinase [Planctomycetaceae bacterium]
MNDSKGRPQDTPSKVAFVQRLYDRLLSQGGLDHEIELGDEQQLAPELLRDYEILKLLGEGANGRVYQARHRTLNKLVAIKVLKANLSTSASSKRRFLRETEASGAVSHQHLIKALDARYDDGCGYIVFEYLDGIILSDFLRHSSPLPTGAACELVRQIAEGLDHIDQAGLVHRDLKPSNILLSRSSQTAPDTPRTIVKILDLGLAALTDRADEESLTQAGQILGSMDYIAPEQIQDSRGVDIRADLYSLGCVMYELLSGNVPYSHIKPTLGKLHAHLYESPPDLKAFRPELPQELCELVGNLLSRELDARLQSPQILISRISPFCDSKELENTFDQYLHLAETTGILSKETSLAGNTYTQSVLSVSRADKKTAKQRNFLLLGLLATGILVTVALQNLPVRENKASLPVQLNEPDIDNSQAPLPVSRYLYFDGVDDAVKTPILLDSDLTYTMEAWITPAATLDHRKKEIISNAETAGISIFSKEDRNLSFYLHDGNSYNNVTMENACTPGKKLHLTVTYSGIGMQMFVDGRPSGVEVPVRSRHRASPLPLYLAANPDPLLAGRHKETLRDCFPGIFHQFRIREGVHYRSQFIPEQDFTPDDQTLVLYRFDSGSGAVARDLSGHGNDGEILGARWLNPEDLTTELLNPSFEWIAGAPEPAIAPFDHSQALKHQQEWAEYLKVPHHLLLNAGQEQIEFTLIPPGEFLMGTEIEIIERLIPQLPPQGGFRWQTMMRAETPSHRVIISNPFMMGRYEVSRGLYRIYCIETGTAFPDEDTDTAASDFSKNQPKVNDLTDQHPITGIPQPEIKPFLDWLQQLESFREYEVLLATEAEWEHACRAGTTSHWNGTTDSAPESLGWFSENSGRQLQAGGLKTPNAWGLYDMHGNAQEWCRDYYRDSGYNQTVRVNPEMGMTDHFINVRGGHYNLPSLLGRSASRAPLPIDTRSEYTGIRLTLKFRKLPDSSPAADQ